ncbi:MAG: hypothetical protein AUH92_00360 [Acidobacteria bacterium 13_1_40CM_4_69_4]|nr:MAG: hypothetical protein AUH92_00360 [Acidobacteria bacterium 13_1_40CM_4_69_4]
MALPRSQRVDRRPLSRLRGLFLTGLVIILPLVITVWMLRILFGMVHGVSTPFILKILRLLGLSLVDDRSFTTYLAPLIGVAATLFLILLVGLLTTNFLGRRIVKAFDRLMLRIPLIKPIYGAARQLLDALDRKTDTFQRVVAVEYPRPGVFTIGFVAREDTTLRTSDERRGMSGYTLVFLPTTPNPTSGWLAALPERDIVPLDMTVEEGIRTIVSGGLVLPTRWEPR